MKLNSGAETLEGHFSCKLSPGKCEDKHVFEMFYVYS